MKDPPPPTSRKTTFKKPSLIRVKGWFEFLGENTEKHITFSVPINRERDNGKTITYKLKCIDSFRFMSTSLSKLVDNLLEIYNEDCK